MQPIVLKAERPKLPWFNQNQYELKASGDYDEAYIGALANLYETKPLPLSALRKSHIQKDILTVFNESQSSKVGIYFSKDLWHSGYAGVRWLLQQSLHQYEDYGPWSLFAFEYNNVDEIKKILWYFRKHIAQWKKELWMVMIHEHGDEQSIGNSNFDYLTSKQVKKWKIDFLMEELAWGSLLLYSCITGKVLAPTLAEQLEHIGVSAPNYIIQWTSASPNAKIVFPASLDIFTTENWLIRFNDKHFTIKQEDVKGEERDVLNFSSQRNDNDTSHYFFNYHPNITK